MGIIKELKSVSQIKKVPIDEQVYRNIEVWKKIYSGYYPEWHRVKYHTIASGHKTRDMARMGMAKVAAHEMASLIFNERCDISFSGEEFGENVDQVLEDNGFRKNFQDHLEYMFGIGGTVIKPYYDEGKIKISYVPADAFVPVSWDNTRIYEAVFLNQTREGNKHYTQLEWHLKTDTGYKIVNELYESDRGDQLGHKVPLSVLYKDLEDEVVIDDLEKPLFVYIKPNTANSKDLDSPLGVPIYAEALDTLKSLDIAFDSLQREFRLGKKRILIPSTAVRAIVDNETGNVVRYFDAEDEVYQAVAYGNLDDNKIHDNSVELRVDEHITAINALLNMLAVQMGFSPGTFTFDGQGVKTATEVISENSKTFKTKKSHEILVEQGIRELVDSIAALAKLYNLFPVPAEYEVTVAFDDSIIEDENTEIDKQIKLVLNKLTSRKRAVMEIHGVTEEEAEQILMEIYQEDLELREPEDEEIESALFGARE